MLKLRSGKAKFRRTCRRTNARTDVQKPNQSVTAMSSLSPLVNIFLSMITHEINFYFTPTSNIWKKRIRKGLYNLHHCKTTLSKSGFVRKIFSWLFVMHLFTENIKYLKQTMLKVVCFRFFFTVMSVCECRVLKTYCTFTWFCNNLINFVCFSFTLFFATFNGGTFLHYSCWTALMKLMLLFSPFRLFFPRNFPRRLNLIMCWK